jgi:hypothetical protein
VPQKAVDDHATLQKSGLFDGSNSKPAAVSVDLIESMVDFENIIPLTAIFDPDGKLEAR